ncbi:MAG: Asp-tRNA(Asn)/Glu-tRNA(Gln) amidotransferase GatCAB subunit B, partial [Rhodospirillaceae bacterium]|nr:Asp-tRNA(Asn)/Glu-tRNA(Gln) amidotransferase GatCAB subunit B [Rhodospirillaceae bacterium]
EFIEEIRSTLPELPDEKKQRFISEFGLSSYDADVLVAERPIAEYFEEAAKGQDAKIVANWVTSDLFGYLNKEGLEISDSPVTGNQLGALVGLISNGTISGRIARDVFSEMCETGKDPAEIVEAKGLKQVSDTGELEELIDEVISNGRAQLEQFKSGNEKIIGWFVGQVMQATKGQANPQMVNEILRRKLAE